MPKRRAVSISASAVRDIEGIGLYIAENGDIVTALRIMTELEGRCNSLSGFAERGNRPKELLAIGMSKYRELHHKRYRIVYEVGNEHVIVHAVVDGRRDMDALLRQRLPH